MHWPPDALITRRLALRLADQPAHDLTRAAAALLEADYGISHPNALDQLVPRIRATSQALAGHPHQPAHLDPLVRRQLRHTLTLDARPPGRHADIPWDLDRT